MDTSKKIATALLDIEAVKLNVKEPFTWASGWKSPIYCDNRKILSYPEIRRLVRECFVAGIRKLYPDVRVIAGVATGAIAHGVLVAEHLDLPFVYVRASAKTHGLENLIEGELPQGAKVVVVEDLISTGGSSIAAVKALQKAGAEVLGLFAIFSYDFDAAVENFNNAGCAFNTLSNYAALLETALECRYIDPADFAILKRWREAPDRFGL
jgi:orotate phosphoribosyltransferase